MAFLSLLWQNIKFRSRPTHKSACISEIENSAPELEARGRRRSRQKSLEDYELIESKRRGVLGKGAYSVVKLIKEKETNANFALKIVKNEEKDKASERLLPFRPL